MTPRLDHPAMADFTPAGIAPGEAEIAALTSDERATYEADAFFRGVVDTVFAMEQHHPGGFTRPALVRETYGGDWEREIADLEAGRHPLIHPSRASR